MNRPLRIAAVTGGMLLVGALAGAVAAALALLVAIALTHPPFHLAVWGVLALAGMIGAVYGGVLLPVTAWILLRRVPIGLALLGLVLGTVIGGVLGWVSHLGRDLSTGGVYGAMLGFALAAILLRLRASVPVTPRVSVHG